MKWMVRLRIVLFILFLAGQGHHALCQATANRLPTLPLQFNHAQRFQARYVDSVLTHTRLALSRVESLPRSKMTDTLRLELLVHLTFVYRFAPQREDSVGVVARQLVQLATNWHSVRFQVRGLLLEEYYYYTVKADFPKALQTNYQAMRLAETDPATSDRYLWRIQRNLGKLSYRMGKYDESIRFYKTATQNLKRDLPAPRPLDRADLLQLMSESYKFQNRLDSAEHCSAEALRLVKVNSPFNSTSLAYLHGDLAVIYRHQKRYADALTQLRLAEAYWQKMGGRNGLAVTWASMAHTLYLTNQPEQAVLYSQKALAYDGGIISTQLLIYETLSLASAAKNDWQTAFRYHQQFKNLADSTQKQRKVTETVTLQANFDREKLVLSQRQTQLLQEQRYLTLQREKELQEQQFLIVAKETELQKLQAFTEQQRLIQMARQTQLQRKLETEALKTQAQIQQNQQQNQIKTLLLNELQSRLTLQERTRSFGLALAALIGLSLLGYNILLRRKNRALRRANQEITAALEHGQTQEMAALRAQMNPHFLFNCINSIKLYTLQNDTDKASDYLTKFARLIRLVLENSRVERVTLQNELEALRLYSDLEAMRFKQKVSILIQVDPDIDQEYIQIPPLLLQPYVENAIWHGLMHKFEGGSVLIDITQPNDHFLHVEITDDGIGRARANELKSKSATGKHKSFGMQVTANRLRILNQPFDVQAQTRILDLIAPNGDPLGTKVVLEIPV